MELKKVIITKKQDEIRKTLKSCYQFKDQPRELLLSHFCETKRGWNPYVNEFTSKLTLEEFISIFIFDNYEVEKTGEEKLIEHYNSLLNENRDTADERRIIKDTLDIMGLTINGINSNNS